MDRGVHKGAGRSPGVTRTINENDPCPRRRAAADMDQTGQRARTTDSERMWGGVELTLNHNLFPGASPRRQIFMRIVAVGGGILRSIYRSGCDLTRA